MADYKVSLGAEVRTGEIDKQLKNYNGSVNVKVNPDGITSGIDSALRGYSAAPIEVKSTLNTQGITDKLKNFSEKKNRTHIKVDVDPQLTGVGTTLENYFASSDAKALRVKVDINWAGVKGQIQTPSEDIGKLQLDAELNKGAIGNAIKNFNKEINAAESKVKIKVKVDPDLKSINTKLKAYQANIKPLKIMPNLKKSEIDKQISAYNNRKNKRNIQLKAKLADGTIDEAITKYVSKEMVPVTVKFTVGSTESIDKKIASYQTNGVDVPVRLIPAQKDFTAKVKNTPVNVTAQIDPVEIQKDVEAAVGGYTPTAKMPINIRLTQPKDINEQVKALVKPTERIEVGIKLEESNINTDIALFQPTATLGIKPDLILENVDDQIAAYTPSVPVKVNVLFNDGNVDEKTGMKKMQDPIQVNVHLNYEDINKQVENINPTSKVKVGVKLDFASHKNEDGKEIQKGIAQQIKEYEAKSKIKVGVELDKESVDKTVQNFKTDVPIKLDVDLNTEPAEKRIEELKAEFKKFGNININFVGADNNGATSSATSAAATGVSSSVGKASSVAHQFREVDITVNNTTGAVENLNKALSDVGFNSSSIDVITKDFEELGISVRNITSRLNDDGSVTLTVKGIDQLERAVKVMRSVDEKGNVTNLGTTISQDFKDTESAFKRLKSIGKEISQLDIKIAGLDARKDSAEIDRLTEKLNRLESEYNELFNLTEGKLTSSQIDELVRDIVDGSEKLDVLKAKLKDARNEAANAIRIKFNDGDFNVLSGLNSEIRKLSGTYPELEASVKEVESAIRDMEAAIGTGDEVADIEKLISAYERYKHAIKNSNNQLNDARRLEQEAAAHQKLIDDRALLQSKIDAWLTKNSAAAKKFGDRLREIKIEAQSADRVKLDSLQSEFKQIDKDAEAAGLRMQTFGDRLKTQFQKYQSYFSVASLFMYAGQALRSMFEQVKLIDSAMTELKKVTSETDDSYNKFLTKAASRAKELGTTIDGLVSSTADFARLGYSFKDAQGLAEVANIYAVVGDDIDGVEDATQSLISTLAAFKHEMGDMSNDDFAMSIVDKMNEVANNYAISSGGLGEALQRSASSMAAANNTLDETIAMITAANEVAQNPEKVGNAMKTMSMRIRGAKTELEEAGESTDGMAESTASLRAEMLALSGVDIMLNENTFKSTYQIMDELSKKWEDLSDIAQATIIELVAGKHQGNVFSSLMANFDTARAALDTSVNSSGSAMAEHAKWSESLEARLNRLSAAWQGLSQAFLSSDFLKVALNSVIGLVDGLSKLIDAIGVIPTFTTAFSAFQSLKGNGLFKVIEDEAALTGKRITSVFSEVAAIMKQPFDTSFSFDVGFEASLNSDIAAIDNFVAKVQSGVVAEEAFAQTMREASAEAQNFAQTMNVATMSSSQFKTIATKNQITKQAASFKNARRLINEYNSGLKTCGLQQGDFLNAIGKSNRGLSQYLSGVEQGSASIAEYVVSLVGAKVATVALQAVTLALNAAITMGISLIVTGLVSAITNWINKEEELAEKIEDVTSKYKERHSELTKNKSSFESQAKAYMELSKGVDEYGRNLSLTADEYSKYQDASNSIADQVPSLVKGFDEEGNAILGVVDSVNTLTEAYNGLIIASNNEILIKGQDGVGAEEIFDNFKTQFQKTSESSELGEIGKNALKNILSSDDLDEAINKYARTGSQAAVAIADAFRAQGYTQGGSDTWWNIFDDESGHDYIKRIIQQNREAVKGIANDYENAIESNMSGIRSATKAYFSNAFLTDYSDIGDVGQDIINSVIPNLNSDFYNKFDSWESVATRFKSMLDSIRNLSDDEENKIEASLELKTRFNNGDISYGDYVSKIKEASDFITNSGLDDEIKHQLQLDLNVKKVAEDYDALKNYLTSEIGLGDNEIEGFLDDLTSSEYAVYVDIKANNEPLLNSFKGDIDSFRGYLEHQAKINEALNFKASISTDTTALEAFNTALSESASAIGLTSESISALKSKYKDLETYDPAALFEATTNGVKLNQKEVERLEKEHQNLTKSKVKEHLETLVDAYNDNVKAIDECSNASERARLISENQAYKSRIEELAQYQAQLEGVTGAYQRWIDAQNTPEDYEGYKAAADGWKTVEDELSRGLLGNASKKYIDLLSGKDLQDADFSDYINAWNALDDKITSTGLSVKDFFTLDDDGNITAAGINNFFKSVEEQYNGLIYKQNEAGEWFYDFSSDNLKQIQEDWGMGIDAIGLILEAATSAGYNIDWGNILSGIDLDTAGFETLIELAETAQSKFNEISDASDVSFNFKTTSIEDATSELEKAKEIYQDVITDDDGNVNLHAEGADELRTILSVLTLQKEELERPAIMDVKVETSVAQTDIGKVTTLVQDLQNNLWKLEQSEYDLSINSDDVQADIVNIAKQLALFNPEIFAKLGLEQGEIDSLASVIGRIILRPKAEISEEDLGTIQSSIQSIDATVVADVLTEEAEGTGTVTMTPDKTDFGDIFEGTGIAKMSPNKTDFGHIFSGTGSVYLSPIYTGKASGTAHASGTTSGKAFARGNWGIKGSGTALGGELGQELVVRDGKFFTIGDTGAEFFHYKKNDIIFNAAQTESLFKYGGIKGAKPRGTMLAGGTAFAEGNAFASGIFKSGTTLSDLVNSVKNKVVETYNKVKDYITGNKKSSSTASVDAVTNASASASKSNANVNINVTATKSDSVDNTDIKPSSSGGKNKGGGGSGGGSSSSGSSDDDKDFFDWIEILIDRIERAIDHFEKKANNVFDSWENRGNALNKQSDLIRQEIEKQQEAYDYYLQYANNLVISSDSEKDAEYKERIQNGTIKISEYTGDDREKLENYKQFYDKALDCKDAIEELKEAESELYKQRLDNVVTRYEGILGVIEHEKSTLEEYINQSEAQAWLVSREYYNALADNERENVAELEAQKAEMLNAFNEAMDSGTIAEGSEAYYEMVASIDEVTLAITESHTTLLEYEQTLQQLDWEVFDILQDKISSVTDETEFLIELLSSDKLFDDNGQLTDAGMATMGQHGVAYNAYMHQADLAAAEAAKLKAELEKDPYDTELEERYREMISLQQEHILSAQGEKEAVRDLVEEGISLELEALQELIDKKNEALESERDLYEYQKKVKEQTEEIASLEKQMAAYSGDDSEEAKQKIQKIKVDLESARQDLEEAEYDKFIDDSSAMLDELYLDYETILNTRLDNIDALLEDMIEEINLNAVDISNTLSEKADSVGYTLSDSMTEIWDKNSVSTQNVITTYSEKFITAQTTTNNALDSINIKLQDMINKLNEKATANVKSASTSSVAKSTTTKSTTTTTTTKKSTSGGDGTPKIGDKVKFVDGQYYYDSYGMRPLGSQKQGQYVYITNINKKSGATHPYHISTGTKLGSGDLGWLKLSQISGYATGKKNFSNDEIAWTQEGATEFIVRPSDGAILTPIAKRDSVLTSAASRNIWDMANSPAEFIKNNLNLGSAGVPNNSNVQNNYTQHLEKVVISFPNVKNYDEVLSALRDDKSFEKLVHSMTIDRIAGKSSLAKGKSIR